MFCTNCGKEDREGQKFCQYCGAPLEPAAAGKKPGFRLRPVYWVLIGEIALAAAGIVLGWKVCRERSSGTAVQKRRRYEKQPSHSGIRGKKMVFL